MKITKELLKQIIKEEIQSLKEQEEELADKQPLRRIAAGVVVNMINQGLYPSKTQHFSWSRRLEDLEERSLDNAVEVIKDNFSRKFLMAPASPEMMEKLKPFLKAADTRSDAFLKLNQFFNKRTTASALKQDAAFTAIEMFQTLEGDMQKYYKQLSQGYPDAYSTLFQTAYDEAKRIKAAAQKGDQKALQLLLTYAKLGKAKVVYDAMVSVSYESKETESGGKDSTYTSRTDDRSFQYVTARLVKV